MPPFDPGHETYWHVAPFAWLLLFCILGLVVVLIALPGRPDMSERLVLWRRRLGTKPIGPWSQAAIEHSLQDAEGDERVIHQVAATQHVELETVILPEGVHPAGGECRQRIVCATCEGEGKTKRGPCKNCRGKGFVRYI